MNFDPAFSSTIQRYEWQVEFQDVSTQEWSATWVDLGESTTAAFTMPSGAARARIKAFLTNTSGYRTPVLFLGGETIANTDYTPLLLTHVVVAPNPVQSDAAVSYRLNNSAQVSLELFDAMSNSVAVLQTPTHQSAGMQSATFPLPTLSSGMYRLRLRAQGQMGNIHYVTQPVMIIR
ncbi:MAG: T9SS C-terminal target domain-containing protein [Candidatus Kapaibacterium sp.]|nr:MAG: T9SS C-terminal target domain-containing protein [Candidatus Kapabacteria bacterium]